MQEGQTEPAQNCSIRKKFSCIVGLPYIMLYFIRVSFSPFSAPLTDKPPKILFPSENKISNMELQLGKSIMGFPPAALSSIRVISKMTANGWLYKSSPTHLRALNADWWWHFYLWEKKKKRHKRNNCKMLSIYANGGRSCPQGCFVNNEEPIWCQGSIRWLATWKGGCFHSPLFVFSDVRSRWAYTKCACVPDWIYPRRRVCFCDSILLDFWAQSAVHMALAAPPMACASVVARPVGQYWRVWRAERGIGWVCERQRGGGERQRRVNDSLRGYLLSSIRAAGIQVVHLKCLHGWLIKSEELLPRLNRQARPHASA